MIQIASKEQMGSSDIVIGLDLSGSMSAPSTIMPGKNRFEEMREDVMRIAQEAEKYDDDGIDVVWFNNRIDIVEGVTASAVERVFQEKRPGGGTNTAGVIKAIAGLAKNSSKNVVAIIFTDGEPNDRRAVVKEINKAAKNLGRPKIGFMFIQIGSDPSAAAFLESLDDDLPIDVVDTKTADEAAELSIEEIVYLAQTD